MNLSASTWNYLCSQGNAADMHEAITEILSGGLGVELWLGWGPDPAAVARDKWEGLKELLADCPAVSLHSRTGRWECSRGCAF